MSSPNSVQISAISLILPPEMQSNRTPVLIAAIILLVLAGIFYYFRSSTKPMYNWSESSWQKNQGYSEQSDQPYGTFIAHRLLQRYFPGKRVINLTDNIAEELPENGKGDNYVFIGEALYMDSLGTDKLLKFVRAGNTAFISSKSIPFDLMNYVYYQECDNIAWTDYDSVNDSIGMLSLYTPQLPDSAYEYFYAVQNKSVPYVWNYLSPYVFCDSLPQHPLGFLNRFKVNFAEFPCGKGKFLLHTSPIVFSNFSMLRPETQPYVEGVWSHLSEGNIYWDAMSRVPESVGRRRNRSDFNRFQEEENPLTYILKQKSLAWAWYLLMGTAGLWLVFRAKRRQRIIPVLKPNENSSYEFISTIANLHFREKNYQNLSKQGMKLFLNQLRERYGLAVTIDAQTELPRTDAEFFKKLALFSEVPENVARDIFEKYTAIVRYQPTEDMMTELHVAMEGFLRRAR